MTTPLTSPTELIETIRSFKRRLSDLQVEIDIHHRRCQRDLDGMQAYLDALRTEYNNHLKQHQQEPTP